MGLEFLAFEDGFISVARLGTYLPPGTHLQQSSHSAANQIVIVGDEYLKGRHLNTFPRKARRRGGWRFTVSNTESVGLATVK